MDRDTMKANQAISQGKRYFRVHRPGIVERAARVLLQRCQELGTDMNNDWCPELAPLTLDERKQARQMAMSNPSQPVTK